MTSQDHDSDVQRSEPADTGEGLGFEITFENEVNEWPNDMTSDESGSDLESFRSDLEKDLLSESNTTEAQDEVNRVPLSPNPNRRKLSPKRRRRSSGANTGGKRKLVHNSSPKAEKSGKKRSCSVDIGQSPKPKRKKEDLKEVVGKKSVPGVIRILGHRVDRQKMKGKIADMESLIFVGTAAKKVFGFSIDLSLIKSQLPARSDLENIEKEIEEIKNEIKVKGNEGAGMEVTEEMKHRLVDIEEKIEKLKEQTREESRKIKDLDELFTTEGVSMETLKEKFTSTFPKSFLEQIATNQDQGSLPTREQLQNDLKDLESKLFAKDNNFTTNFPGLPEAMAKTTGWPPFPDDLKPIACRIEKACDKTIDFVRENLALLVCIAIKEMEDTPIEELTWPMLLKWGATLNEARELRFQVDFAENLLKKNLHSYYLHSKLG